MKLMLRRAVVLDAQDVVDGGEQRLVIEVDGGREREAVCDTALFGTCEAGDELVVNTQASELSLGSGGFDIVHVNLTRGLEGVGVAGAHVMKLNYTSLQHAVLPVEGDADEPEVQGKPVAACLLHGQLAPLAWAYRQEFPQGRLGLVQGAGGALPGNHSRTVAELLAAGLVDGFITAAPSYGGEFESMSVAGGLAHGFAELGWDAAVCAPGPGIIGSGSRYGNGAIAAADSLNAALGLGAQAVLVPRLSDSDPRERHRGTSHHTRTVAAMMLSPVAVGWPEGREQDDLSGMRIVTRNADIEGYAASGLPSTSMGRTIGEDPAFFAGALAAGALLGSMSAR